MAESQDPGLSCWFSIEFQGVIEGAFKECSGFGSESQVVEYKGCDENNLNHYNVSPGKLKVNQITLKKGITGSDLKFWDWRKLVELGQMAEARKDGTIKMHGPNGEPLAQWNFFGAWPVSITGPSINAGSNEVAIEDLKLVMNSYERVPV